MPGLGHGFGPSITQDPLTTYLIGSTRAGGAASVRVVMTNHAAAVLTLMFPSADVSQGVGYYAASFDGGPTIQAVQTLNGDGQIVETNVIRQ